MSFGQLVIGPPGSGKTTYCFGMKQFLEGLGRKVAVVNLDPANHTTPYESSIDIRELIQLEDVTEEFDLGPNGGLIYCMEFLEQNYKWLEDKLNILTDHYLLIDCPGQVELYTHYTSTRNIVTKLAAAGNRLTCVHLVDSYYCSSPFTYVSAVMLSLNTMIQLELPHVNVFSKVDLIEKYGELDFGLDFYTSVDNLHHLQHAMEGKGPYSEKLKDLTNAIGDVVDDFGLVSFQTLSVNDKRSMGQLIKQIDRANGYIYTTEAYSDVLNQIYSADVEMDNSLLEIHEYYKEFGDTQD